MSWGGEAGRELCVQLSRGSWKKGQALKSRILDLAPSRSFPSCVALGKMLCGGGSFSTSVNWGQQMSRESVLPSPRIGLKIPWAVKQVSVTCRWKADFVIATQFHLFSKRKQRPREGRTFQDHSSLTTTQRSGSRSGNFHTKLQKKSLQFCNFLPVELCSSKMSSPSLGSQSPQSQQSTFRWLTSECPGLYFFYFKPNHLIKEWSISFPQPPHSQVQIADAQMNNSSSLSKTFHLLTWSSQDLSAMRAELETVRYPQFPLFAECLYCAIHFAEYLYSSYSFQKLCGAGTILSTSQRWGAPVRGDQNHRMSHHTANMLWSWDPGCFESSLCFYQHRLHDSQYVLNILSKRRRVDCF